MKKQFFLVGIIAILSLGVFGTSCQKEEDNKASHESSIESPIVVINQRNSCDCLEWNVVDGAKKYRVMESESRAELEKINYPIQGSAYPVSVYVDLYQTYLTLCDKVPLYKIDNVSVMYYVVFAIGKSDNEYSKSKIISYTIK